LRGLKDPTEFVNEAVELVLSGQRKAAPRHLKSLDSFYNYLQAVIQSLISHGLEITVRQGNHVSLDSVDVSKNELVVSDDIIGRVSRAETGESLFRRLRQSAIGNPELLRTIAVWEESWTVSDRIPKCNLSDKQVHDLRIKSRQILQQAAARDGIAEPTGKEIL